jgi:hypothetical protein
MPTSLLRCTIAWSALFLALAAPARATADNYYLPPGEFRREIISDTTLLARGRFEGGINFAATLGANRATADRVETSESLFIYANPNGFFGYMLTGRLQLRFNLGYLGIYSVQNDLVEQNAHTLLGSIQLLYHVPLPLGFAFYFGGGGAGYYGAARRFIPETRIRVVNRAAGGGAQLLFGLLMQPSHLLTMRAGLRLDALFGVERPEDPSLGLPARTGQNFNVMIELCLGFRGGRPRPARR